MPRAMLLLAALLAAPAAPAFAGEIGPAEAARLKHLVAHDCGACPGMTRKGGLGTPLTRAALEGQDREGLAAIILDGVPQTAMPPWRPLMSEAEAYWIADYLLGAEEIGAEEMGTEEK